MGKVVCNLVFGCIMGYRNRGGVKVERGTVWETFQKTIDKQKAKDYIRNIEISTRLK